LLVAVFNAIRSSWKDLKLTNHSYRPGVKLVFLQNLVAGWHSSIVQCKKK
jgi:hypothetical protein